MVSANLPRIMRETSVSVGPGAPSLDLAQSRAAGSGSGSQLVAVMSQQEFCSFVRQAGRHRSCRSTGESRATGLVTGNPKCTSGCSSAVQL